MEQQLFQDIVVIRGILGTQMQAFLKIHQRASYRSFHTMLHVAMPLGAKVLKVVGIFHLLGKVKSRL
jgi:hypothetical protein